MNILKYEDFISEGLWKKGFERGKTGELRKEQGRKVKTSIGVEIILKNPDFNYEEFIQDILNTSEDDFLGISFSSIQLWNAKDQKEIRNGENEYKFLLYDYKYSNTVCAFDSYEEISEDDPYLLHDSSGITIDKDDYLSIIKGIVEALRKTTIDKSKGSYEADYYFLLIDEDELYSYECEFFEKYGENSDYWDDFKMFFEDSFPNVELEFWSYNNYSSNIGMKIDYENLLQYEKCKEFINNYFKNLKDYYDDGEEV